MQYRSRLTGCEVPRADILFVLDGSGSIEAANFELMKDFVENVVSDYDIGAEAVRVGLIRYSTTSDLEFGLGTHNDLSSLLEAIDSVQYTEGGTNSHLALQVGTIHLKINFENIMRASGATHFSTWAHVRSAYAAKLHGRNLL